MVYLIGAGPGHPGLMTCQGAQLLKKCDAVIYDRLGTSEVLDLVPGEAVRIYVGKQAGAHSKKQEQINEILLQTAKKYPIVVRLKGGDPFVFGRGGEEVLALQQAGLPFQIVPGVTSAISVPELMGIPVTHRDASRSFHVYTGHTKAGAPNSLEHIHRAEGTSIFLMGLSHLSDILERLRSEGEPEDTPVSVLSNGTMPGEQRVTGTVGNIVEKVRQSQVASPAIIVVGETAAYQFYSDDIGALSGLKIGVVGTDALRRKMREQLEPKGVRVFDLCRMQLEVLESEPFMQALEKIEIYDWITFTSQNGIRVFFEAIRKRQIDLRRLAKARFAVVGSGTAEALRRQGFAPDYIPEEYTTEALARGLTDRIQPGEKLLLPRARQGSRQMVQILSEHRVDADIIPVYDVVGTKTENWQYLNAFDMITFASASGVESFVREMGQDRVADWEKSRRQSGVRIGTIGKVTAQALAQAGIRADCIPPQCDLKHLILAIEEIAGIEGSDCCETEEERQER